MHTSHSSQLILICALWGLNLKAQSGLPLILTTRCSCDMSWVDIIPGAQPVVRKATHVYMRRRS